MRRHQYTSPVPAKPRISEEGMRAENGAERAAPATSRRYAVGPAAEGPAERYAPEGLTQGLRERAIEFGAAAIAVTGLWAAISPWFLRLQRR